MSLSPHCLQQPTLIVAIGGGNRMRVYLHYVAEHPERARLVAVVEPDKIRRDAIADRFGIPEAYRYHSYEEFFAHPVEADAVFICTPERAHHRPAIEALNRGYHVLLEKPIAQTYEQCKEIFEASQRTGKIVGICYVLRYHPCFQKIKEIVSSGRLGRIISINHTEDVGIDRATHSYVRGVMNTECGNNPMILSKCCHDIDFLSWITGARCRKISSFGSRTWFRGENAPEGSAERCVDCSVESRCPYSAVNLYWRRRQWINNFDVPAGQTLDDVLRRELAEGRFGRCVYHCDNDVVDNQVVTMQMDDGCIVTLCMDIFTRRDGRMTDIKMSGGEIVSDGKTITVTDFARHESFVLDFTEVDAKPFHGGADLKLVESFLNRVRGGGDEESVATIADSLRSHLLCFEAERSRHTGETVTLA